eukprot:4439603-Prymnesium_polylepis.2
MTGRRRGATARSVVARICYRFVGALCSSSAEYTRELILGCFGAVSGHVDCARPHTTASNAFFFRLGPRLVG